MHELMHRNTVFWLVSAVLIISGCNITESKPTDPQAVVKRTIDNLIYVPGGTFIMGDGAFKKDVNGLETEQYWTGEKNDKPPHEVSLDSFYLDKYEVIFDEYDVYTQAKGKPKQFENLAQSGVRSGYPVIVNWYEAKDYCTWLSEVSGLPFDLPTEAQWEYAARNGGKNYLFPTDNGKLERGRNFKIKEKGKEKWWFSPVGMNPPNLMGFYSMAGNVGEWVQDWFDPFYYTDSPINNPKGPQKSPFKEKPWKTSRGGGASLGTVDRNFLVFTRYATLPEKDGNGDIGVRCALQLHEKI